MAGVKISALSAVASAQLTDIFPVVQNNVTSKETISQLVTLLNTSLTGYVPITGGTMTGFLILNADPILPLGAATKEYVDTVASGFTVILACLAGTTGNLNTTYNNGTAGVGATLTDASGTFAVFTVDGVTPALNSRILVKDQTTTFQNGVYVLTTNGDTMSIPYVLTRATDYDQAPSEIHPGTLVAVNTGTVNATSSWLETATVTVIGTDPILFSQFSFGPSSFLLKANNLSDVNSVPTSRTNLGLGTAATKAASDNAKATVASVSGATVINNIAKFSDVNGTVTDSGIPITVTTGRLLNIQKFPSSGTYTATAGTTNVLVKAWGAGAGAGANTNVNFVGGAGGAGAYVEAYVSYTVPVTITIPTGGTGSTANTTATGGSASGDTSYGAVVIAKSGLPGGGANGGATGGLGGQAGACTFPSAGFALSGANGSSSNVFSGLNDWSLPSSSPNNVPGSLRTVPGDGIANSGQGGSGGSTTSNGGTGGSGYIVIYEYC